MWREEKRILWIIDSLIPTDDRQSVHTIGLGLAAVFSPRTFSLKLELKDVPKIKISKPFDILSKSEIITFSKIHHQNVSHIISQPETLRNGFLSAELKKIEFLPTFLFSPRVPARQ